MRVRVPFYNLSTARSHKENLHCVQQAYVNKLLVFSATLCCLQNRCLKLLSLYCHLGVASF